MRNASFHGVALDRLMLKGDTEWPQVAELMKTGLRSGAVKPIEPTVFRPDEVEKAFRFMAQGKHIGKILIKASIP